MLERFRQHVRASGLIPVGSTVLVGYSGGADSTCLLHLLKEIGADVAAGHLHHGQRPEADKEMNLCEVFCSELDIPFVSGRADVPRMAHELKMGLEEAGREARYNFLESAAFRIQCGLIATAHTRSDLIETVLLNLTRGCGMHGLVGIPEQRDNIVRPLLPFSREETRAYCDAQGFWYHDDPANSDISFSRARIRHRVIRELRTINPGFDEAVERMVGIVAAEDRFLNSIAAASLEQCEHRLNDHLGFLTLDVEVAFSRSRMEALPAVLFKRGVRLATEVLGGTLDHTQTEALVSGIRGMERGSVTSEEGKVIVEWTPELIHVRQPATIVPFRQSLTAPGETVSDEFGWSLSALPTTGAPPSKRADLTAAIDPKKVKGQLYFRTAQSGDELQPLGFAGHRKLSALLSDAKLSKAARERLPIICDMIGPIWVPGVCLDARVAADATSGNVLLLQFGPTRDLKGIMLETRPNERT